MRRAKFSSSCVLAVVLFAGVVLQLQPVGAATTPVAQWSSGVPVATTPYASAFAGHRGNWSAWCGGFWPDQISDTVSQCDGTYVEAQGIAPGDTVTGNCLETTGSAPATSVGDELAVCGQSRSGNGGGAADQMFEAVPGGTYTMTAHVYVPSGVVVLGPSGSVASGSCGSTSAIICLTDLVSNRTGVSSSTVTNGSWQTVTTSITASLQATIVQMNLTGSEQSGATASPVYYDSITLTESGGTSGLCGAPGTTQTPWCYQGPTAQTAKFGECNSDYVFPSVSVGSENGYEIQLACQMSVPADGQLPVAIIPSTGASGCQGVWSGTAWTGSSCSSSGSGFEGVDVSTSTGQIGGVIGAASTCNTPYNTGTRGPNLFVGSGSDHPIQCTYVGIPFSGVFNPETDPTVYGSDCWNAESTLVSAQSGAPFTGSDGQQWESVQVIDTWNVQGAPGCGVDDGSVFETHPSFTPSVIGQGTACPTSDQMVDPYDSSLWDGAQLSVPYQGIGSNSPTALMSDYSSDQPFTDSAFTGSLMLDSVTCSYGPFAEIQVSMPTDAAAGGSSESGGTPGAAASACTLTGVTGGKAAADEVAGQTYSITFSYTGQVDKIALDPNPPEVPESGSNITFGTVAPLTLDPGSVVADATSSPQTLSWTATTTTGGDVPQADPAFYCEASGVVYDWGEGSGGNPLVDGGNTVDNGPGSSPTSDLGACFSASGWSLTDPVSWVTGALHDGVCILAYLFEPSSSVISQFTGLFVSNPGDGTANAGQWIGSLANFATEFPTASVSAIQSAADSGSCNVGPVITFVTGHTFSVCSSIGAAASETSWSTIDSIVSATFVIMMGLALFHLVRRAVTGNAA